MGSRRGCFGSCAAGGRERDTVAEASNRAVGWSVPGLLLPATDSPTACAGRSCRRTGRLLPPTRRHLTTLHGVYGTNSKLRPWWCAPRRSARRSSAPLSKTALRVSFPLDN